MYSFLRYLKSYCTLAAPFSLIKVHFLMWNTFEKYDPFKKTVDQKYSFCRLAVKLSLANSQNCSN